MKIAILSRNPKLYSTSRLVKAAEDRGHTVRVLDVLRCYMNITSHNPSIHYRGEDLTGFDAVIPRIGASVTFYGTAVLRQFEMMNVFPLNESVAISRSRDKLRSIQLLARKGMGLPVTGFANNPDDIEDLIAQVGGAPLVIKLLEGTQGIGVVLAETHNAAESVIQAFMGLKANIMVQEFIKEAGGSDIRCFVVGDKVLVRVHKKEPNTCWKFTNKWRGPYTVEAVLNQVDYVLKSPKGRTRKILVHRNNLKRYVERRNGESCATTLDESQARVISPQSSQARNSQAIQEVGLASRTSRANVEVGQRANERERIEIEANIENDQPRTREFLPRMAKKKRDYGEI